MFFSSIYGVRKTNTAVIAAKAPSRGFIWALLGPFICWALLGPGPGPIHLLGPVGAIHLGPVGFFLNNFSEKSSFLVIFHQELTFCDIFFLKVVFYPKNFRRRHVPPSFSACFDRGPFNHPSDRGPFNHISDNLTQKRRFLLKCRFLVRRIY